MDADGHIVRLSGDGAAKLGTVDGLIVGGPSGSTRSVTNLGMRGDVIATDGMLGFPAESQIQLQAGDLVVAAGQRFAVSGPVLWGHSPHSLSGRAPCYKWIAATAN